MSTPRQAVTNHPTGRAGRAGSDSFPPEYHAYDLTEYDFPALIARILDVSDLGAVGREESHERFTRATDQSTLFHQRFYDAFDEVRPLYRRFVREVIAPYMGEEFCFQRVPTFRVQLPTNVAVGEPHTDGDYSHPVGERNFWVPMTKAFESNTIWIETSLGGGRLAPARSLVPGEFLTFDAVRWRHGNVANDTGATRVSFDFRCIPLSKYRPGDGRSVNTQQRFVIGEYFEQ